MNIIETKAPIDIEDLKKHFSEKDVKYVIDYEKSTLKNEKFLTYLSNLDLPCDIVNPDYELLKEYFMSTSIVNIEKLEKMAIDVLMQHKTLKDCGPNIQKFITENLEIVEKWADKLNSLTLYNVYIVKEKSGDPTFKDYVSQFPKDETGSLEGVNFVSILKHQQFYDYYAKVDVNKFKNFTKYFNDYMFRGKSLYEFWANKNNPIFLITWDIARGNGKDFVSALNNCPIIDTKTGQPHVSPI